MEALEQRAQRLFVKRVSHDVKQGAPNQRDIGQEIGVAGTRTIFSHQHIAPPMIADFNPAPVPADQLQPLCRPILLRGRAGEVVARFFGGVSALFVRPLRAHYDQSSGKGKIGCQRFDGKSVEVAHFDAASGVMGVGKKGVLGNAFNPWACLRRLGWLPLIWKR